MIQEPVTKCGKNPLRMARKVILSQKSYINIRHMEYSIHTCISCSSLMLASNSALSVSISCWCFSPISSISIRARFWYCSSTLWTPFVRVRGDNRECVRGRDGEKKEQSNVYLEPRTNATYWWCANKDGVINHRRACAARVKVRAGNSE